MERTTARLLITGSREWSDADLMNRALRWAWRELRGQGFEEVVLVHGGARGADQLAGRLWAQVGLPVEVHQAEWDKYREELGPGRGNPAGHIRNAKMVDLGADLCLAFPMGKSAGTRGCMKLVEKAGIPMKVAPE